MTEKLAVRTQIYLEKGQHEALKRKAAEKSTSMASLIREAVAIYLTQSDTDEDLGLKAYLSDPIWKIPEVAQTFEGTGFADAAVKHDEYIYVRK